jgi:pteridine reductase
MVLNVLGLTKLKSVILSEAKNPNQRCCGKPSWVGFFTTLRFVQNDISKLTAILRKSYQVLAKEYPMNPKNKVALITGAAKRVGRAIALDLAAQGCHIAVHYGRSAAEAEQTAAEIRALGVSAWTISADLSDESAVKSLVPTVLEQAGRLDILVNNASVFLPEEFATADSARWDKTMMINLKAPFLLSQAMTAALPENGPGKIINLLDTDSDRPRNHHFAYTISKAALNALNAALAHALAERNIQVNGVALGAILPDVHSEDDTHFQKLGQQVPAKRTGSLVDVTQAVRYFLEADYVTGEIIRLDGGKHLL